MKCLTNKETEILIFFLLLFFLVLDYSNNKANLN